MRRTTHHFVGYALTPVHVGDGTTITPNGYRLHQSDGQTVLERFDPPAVIAAMPSGVKNQYINALSKGSLKEAQDILSKAAGSGTAIKERLPVSENSRDEIEYAVNHPLQRSGSISSFVRSGGTPILPGSSVKGAIRTAWLAAAAAELRPDQVRRFVESIENTAPGKTAGISNEVQNTAFDFEQHHTEQDPLRDISVSDAALERDSTVIDRAQVAKCTKDGPVAIGDVDDNDRGWKKIQIHVERLASFADPGEFPAKPFKIDISVPDGEAIKERLRLAEARVAGNPKLPRAIPRHSRRLEDLRQMTNAHHAALWFYERERFYRNTRTRRLLDELLVKFGLPAQREQFEPAINGMGAWLIKVGRFGHFESKSIEVGGRRYGEKARTKQHRARFMSEGGSRTVAEDTDGRLLPFGWVLLFPEDRAPKAVRQPDRRAQSSTGQYRFRKGDRVTNGDEIAVVERDVRHVDTRMEVRFDDGIESVPIEGWRLAR